MCALACIPAWAARSALTTIPGDEDGLASDHLVTAGITLAIAAGLVGYAITTVGARGPWRVAAAILLPAIWLPSAAHVAAALQVLFTLIVAALALACLERALATSRGPVASTD